MLKKKTVPSGIQDIVIFLDWRSPREKIREKVMLSVVAPTSGGVADQRDQRMA